MSDKQKKPKIDLNSPFNENKVIDNPTLNIIKRQPQEKGSLLPETSLDDTTNTTSENDLLKQEQVEPTRLFIDESTIENTSEINNEITTNIEDSEKKQEKEIIKVALNEEILEKSKKDKIKYIGKVPKIKASKLTLIPGFLISLVFLCCAIWVPPISILNLIMTNSEFQLLPEFIKSNASQSIKVILYLLSLFSFYLAIKASHKGNLKIYPSYILYTKNFKSQKLLMHEIISIEIHWCVFSTIAEIGNLEISSLRGDIHLKNFAEPTKIKEKILKTKEELLLNQSTIK